MTTRLRTVLAFLPALAAIAAAGPAHDEPAQQRRMMRFDADKAVVIHETGMVVTDQEGKLKVEFIPPAESRPKETAGADIAAGDEVGMAGGKNVGSIAELRAAYEAAKPGDEFKLGLRRDGRSFVVTLKRMNEKDLPRTMMVRREGPGGGPGGDRGNPNVDVLPALGAAIEFKDGRVSIVETFPNAPKEMAKGDVIVSLNGKAIKSLADFTDVYDGAEVGTELRFELSREGRTVTVVTKRNRPQRQTVID